MKFISTYFLGIPWIHKIRSFIITIFKNSSLEPDISDNLINTLNNIKHENEHDKEHVEISSTNVGQKRQYKDIENNNTETSVSNISSMNSIKNTVVNRVSITKLQIKPNPQYTILKNLPQFINKSQWNISNVSYLSSSVNNDNTDISNENNPNVHCINSEENTQKRNHGRWGINGKWYNSQPMINMPIACTGKIQTSLSSNNIHVQDKNKKLSLIEKFFDKCKDISKMKLQLPQTKKESTKSKIRKIVSNSFYQNNDSNTPEDEIKGKVGKNLGNKSKYLPNKENVDNTQPKGNDYSILCQKKQLATTSNISQLHILNKKDNLSKNKILAMKTPRTINPNNIKECSVFSRKIDQEQGITKTKAKQNIFKLLNQNMRK